MDFRYQLINPWVPDTESYTTFCHSKVFLKYFTKQLNYAPLVELDLLYLVLEFYSSKFPYMVIEEIGNLKFTVSYALIWSWKQKGDLEFYSIRVRMQSTKINSVNIVKLSKIRVGGKHF